MNQTTSIFTLLLLAISMMLFSCRKKAEDDKEERSSADQTIGSNGETFFSSLLDQMIDDAEGLFARSSLAGAKTAHFTPMLHLQ